MKRALLLILGLGLLSGCEMLDEVMGFFVSGEEEVVSELAPTARGKEKAGKDADADSAEEVEEYVYNPIGRRDPFRSFLATYGTRVQSDTPRTPLQKYEIDEYALVGIVWGMERPRALVEDPEGTGHVMEIGTYIGKNWGKVTQITSSEVVVTEEFQNLNGDLVVNTITMALPMSDEGEIR